MIIVWSGGFGAGSANSEAGQKERGEGEALQDNLRVLRRANRQHDKIIAITRL